MLRREPKAAVIPYSTAPTTTGAVVHVSAIAQGDGLGDRSGDQVYVERIHFAVNVLATASQNIRYILFRDKFNQGTTPAVTDVLTTASVASPFSSLAQIQQKRFQILLDKVMSFSVAGSLAGYARCTLNVNQPTYFTGSATTTKAAGSIYLLVISDVASGAHDVEMQLVYSDY